MMQPGDDPEIDRALSRWKENTPLPAGFKDRVWKRIAEAEGERPAPVVWWWSWLEAAFSRRSFTVSCAMALVALGLLGGLWHGRDERDRLQVDLAARYVRAIASYQNLP